MNNPKLNLKVFRKFRGLAANFFDEGFKRYSKFARYVQKDIENQMILYESSCGQTIDGNSYALFKYLIDNPEYSNFTHVWSTNYLDNKNKIIDKYRNYDNVKFVKRNSDEYLEYLARSKYLISDYTFPDYYFRREDQIYVNVFMDSPLSVSFKDDELGTKQLGEIQRNFLNASYLVHPNKFSINNLLDSFDVDTLVEGLVVDTGHPRVDLLLKADKSKIRKKLNISESDKFILYTPRWNGKTSFKLYVDDLINNIECLKNEIETEYIFKVNLPLHISRLIPDYLKELIVSSDIDINEVLSVVDILITNSSISFDLLTTHKPIIYFLDRRNEFNPYIQLNELPGPVCLNIYDVIDFVKDIEYNSNEYEDNYVEFQKKLSYNNDGNACKRVIEAVFDGATENIVNTKDHKKKLLFYPGSLKTNGITSSFISLLNNIDYDRCNVSVMVNPKDNQDFENFIFNLNKINEKAKILFISNEFNFLSKEYIYHNLILKYGLSNKIKIPKNLYSREIRRLFGNTHFDIFVDFGGYNRLITLLFAFSEINRKYIYLHNNMVGEFKLRFKSLRVTFDLYRYYNKLITVSEDSKKENSVNFKEYGMDLDDKLTYVNNTLDHETIIKNSLSGKVSEINNVQYYFNRYIKNDLSLDLRGIVAPLDNNTNFISIGRLSPEKDHKKLLSAFSKVFEYHDNVRLYILGDGPLKEDLINFADDIRILDQVIFTGNLDNPHWLLNSCNCFVLSSNYEGQGIVILEALVLGKSVISTDIFGPRGILKGRLWKACSQQYRSTS